jgi:N-acetylmuramoyl-L-alanine amidase
MPCTLVELLFIDNQQDARRMARAQFREKLATSIAAGIYSFITPQVSLSNGSGTSVRGRGR